MDDEDGDRTLRYYAWRLVERGMIDSVDDFWSADRSDQISLIGYELVREQEMIPSGLQDADG